MTASRQDILNLILTERQRQYDLPGSEYDSKHTHNDWIAIINQYASRGVTRKHQKIDNEEFRDSLIKAAAVILAALENNS
jgi:hypothetical protein